MSATHPAVWQLEDGSFYCELKDKKQGRVWGTGYGNSRAEAIASARSDKPSESRIKRSIGWITRHPFIGGAAVSMYLTYRDTARHGINHTVRDYLTGAIILGGACWVASKVVKFVKHLINR